MNEIITPGSLAKMSRGELSLPANSGGLTLIKQTLADYGGSLAILGECETDMLSQKFPTYLGEGEISERYLDGARDVLNCLLRHYPRVKSASSTLDRIVGRYGLRAPVIAQPEAMLMLSVLFGALSKKKSDGDDNAGMLLLACADMFDPTNDFIGKVTGFWKNVSQHPLILALAIKRLLATQTFCPSPCEVREAMVYVKDIIEKRMGFWLHPWLRLVERAEQIVFAFDRPGWKAGCGQMDSSVLRAMLDNCFGEEGGEDDDGNPYPPSPRWQALNDLLKAKKSKAAACEAKREKRTRKAKQQTEDAADA
jgi:hypothetical protein